VRPAHTCPCHTIVQYPASPARVASSAARRRSAASARAARARRRRAPGASARGSGAGARAAVENEGARHARAQAAIASAAAARAAGPAGPARPMEAGVISGAAPENGGARPTRAVCFDAGITHVGFVAARIDAAWRVEDIEHAACVDLTKVEHRRVPLAECTLPHGNALAHRFAHFVQEYAPLIERADHIFVEQQPPGSAGMAFEQLLHLKYEHRVRSVHPRSMHKHFGIGGYDYDGRKERAVSIAARAFPGLAERMQSAARGHDIADATCLLLFECSRRRDAAARAEARERAEAAVAAARDRVAFLWEFAYDPEAGASSASAAGGDE